MLYIVQKNIFREENYDKIFEAINKLGLEYEEVEFSEDGDFPYKTERKDVFCFGSVRLARIALKNNWEPGSFYGGNHDFMIYSEYYGDNLLNYDSKIIRMTDQLEWKPGELKFMRPCKDSKVFTGRVFTKIKWDDLVQLKLEEGHELLNENTLIQVSSPKTIYKEARIWIIAGQVVTSSYYKFGQYVVYSENVEPEGLEFVEAMLQIFEVADAFVMDICLTPDGWKIVEINCINCSGFYKGDLQKILIELEYYFNPI